MKNYTLLTAIVSMFLLLGSVAFADGYNPNKIQGYTNLYADLNKDGHLEKVVVKSRMEPVQHCYMTKFVVFNDKGKVLWRSQEAATPFYCNHIEHCLLHDIDGDGNIELVFSGWNCLDNVDSDPNTSIFRWENGKFNTLFGLVYTKFRGYTNTDVFSQGPIDYKLGDDESTRCAMDSHFYDNNKQVNAREWFTFAYERKMGYSRIHNLRKVNGNIWGDIVVYSMGEKENRGFRLASPFKWGPNHCGHTDIYITVRLEPCKGSMRIVEVKP